MVMIIRHSVEKKLLLTRFGIHGESVKTLFFLTESDKTNNHGTCEHCLSFYYSFLHGENPRWPPTLKSFILAIIRLKCGY